MSLQQITLETKGSEGIKKQINQNSIDIVFDVLQVYAYSNPIESTVRELASNAVDAQREKEIALEIISGKAKEEDYFVKKHGKEFEDSKFDITYYDKKCLDAKSNDVLLTYKENEGSGFCDTFTVRDNGVGIGDKRLEGVLQLGYSSKRVSKELIGGFGLGQKAALSTGAPFYTLITAHNGRKFKLNIYSKKADNLIGAFDPDTEQPNKFITFSDGTKVYYEETKEMNYTEIIVPTKRLNKHKYIDAVKSQLLYLPNIKFAVQELSGRKQEVDFSAEVLYESENIIISRNSQYSRPHLIVVKDKSSSTGVCYNEIDYKELELEQRFGQVALKVQIRSVGKDEHGNEYVINDGIAVTPNREQVIWNDDTKNYLLGITRNVTDEAIEIINKELTESDFLKWLQKATTALSNISYGSTLYELSKMIDRSNITPYYVPDKTIKYCNPGEMFWGMLVRKVHLTDYWAKGTSSRRTKIDRDVVNSWGDFADRTVFIKRTDTSHIKDQYIIQEILKYNSQNAYYKGFIMLEPIDSDQLLDDALTLAARSNPTDDQKKKIEAEIVKKIQRRDKILGYIEASPDLRDYDTIEVPDTFKPGADEEEVASTTTTKDGTTTVTVAKSLEELRKENGEIVYHVLRVDNANYWRPNVVWEKVTEKISLLPNLAKRIYYGFDDDKDKLTMACRMLGAEKSDWVNDNLAIIKISRTNEKHIKAVGKHISEFFNTLDVNNKIMVSPEVLQYYTARMLDMSFNTQQFDFLHGYKSIDPNIHAIYQHLLNYYQKYYTRTLRLRDSDTYEAEKAMLAQLYKCYTFQQFVAEGPSETELKAKSTELFGADAATDALIIDPTVYNQLMLLEEYVSEVHTLFNHIDLLTDTDGSTITAEQIKLIRIILDAKGLSTFDIPEELQIKQ